MMSIPKIIDGSSKINLLKGDILRKRISLYTPASYNGSTTDL